MKGKVMNIPIETKPALWGAAFGAIAVAIVGFSWLGWVTGSKSEATAQQRVSAAVVTALAPVCADKFQRSPEMAANLAALKKAESWAQGEFVEKGGWATVAGPPNPPEQVTAVARACAELLVKA